MNRQIAWLIPLVGLLGCEAEPVTPGDAAVLEGWNRISVGEAATLTDAQFVDTRSETNFEAGHIPGALQLDAATLRETVDGIGGQALPRSEADTLLARSGLEADLPIVVYGPANDTGTARVLWSLAYYGASDALRLLDGGLERWTDEGKDIEATAATTFMGPWNGGATRSELRVDQQWVLDHLDDSDVALFDVRSATEYEAGHIPGAIHAEWTQNLDTDGLFRSTEEVLALHDNPSAPTIVVYCQSGARASVSWSLLQFADLGDVRLYDGSWNEWGTDPDTPKVTGPNPR
ncbi:MAG: rhodanese-like domain-containing protein [Myxococcota bacterium]